MRYGGLFLFWLILYFPLSTPSLHIFSFTDEEPGEEEGKEIHLSGNSGFWKSDFLPKENQVNLQDYYNKNLNDLVS